MPRNLTSALPSWLPGFLSYSSLLVINAILPSIAIVTLDDNVATGLEIALVACNSSASVILLGMLLYKAIERSSVFNNFKSDRKALFCVALLDLCAAVGWSVRLDRKVFCAKAAGSTGASSCSLNAALVAAGLVLAWISVIISCCAAVCADHGAKKRRPSPLSVLVSRPAISSPVIIHAGQFSEYERDVDSKFISFTNITLGGPNRGQFLDAV